VKIRTQAFGNIGIEFVKSIKAFSKPPTDEQISRFEDLEDQMKESLSQVLQTIKDIHQMQNRGQPSDDANNLLKMIDVLEAQIGDPMSIPNSEFLGLDRISEGFKSVLETNPFNYTRFSNLLKECVTKVRALLNAKGQNTMPQLVNGVRSLLGSSRVFVMCIINFQHNVNAPTVVASKQMVQNSVSVFMHELEKSVAETMKSCVQCRKPILGGSVSVGAQIFHRECLVCSVCKVQQLECYRFKDAILCEEHYRVATQKLGLNLICTTCNKPVAGQFIEIGGRVWHHGTCFHCEVCSTVLTNEFYLKNNKILCQSCNLK
jgi:hypothetical protein